MSETTTVLTQAEFAESLEAVLQCDAGDMNETAMGAVELLAHHDAALRQALTAAR